MPAAVRLALAAQGLYYLVTGAWPLASMQSFELVTGPKTEHWLVHTVSLLVLAIGASLVTAARTAQGSESIRVLALGVAAAFASMDLYYVGVGRISAAYLLDAAAEITFALWLGIALMRARPEKVA